MKTMRNNGSEMEIKVDGDWVIDDRGNRASVEAYGGEEEAIESLKTLSGCAGCTGCDRCTGCAGCARCTRCAHCEGCTDCEGLKNARQIEQPAGETIGGMPVPVIDDIHRKVFAAASQPNALCMTNWHKCETTHCRAGWVVHLSGDAGYALEKATSTLFAAQQIYRVSGYDISPVRFFDSDEAAMNDMRKLAGVALSY